MIHAATASRTRSCGSFTTATRRWSSPSPIANPGTCGSRIPTTRTGPRRSTGATSRSSFLADHYLRAVWLEPGTHEVVFRYAGPVVTRSLALGLLGTASSALLLLIAARRTLRAHTPRARGGRVIRRRPSELTLAIAVLVLVPAVLLNQALLFGASYSPGIPRASHPPR